MNPILKTTFDNFSLLIRNSFLPKINHSSNGESSKTLKRTWSYQSADFILDIPFWDINDEAISKLWDLLLLDNPLRWEVITTKHALDTLKRYAGRQIGILNCSPFSIKHLKGKTYHLEGDYDIRREKILSELFCPNGFFYDYGSYFNALVKALSNAAKELYRLILFLEINEQKENINVSNLFKYLTREEKSGSRVSSLNLEMTEKVRKILIEDRNAIKPILSLLANGQESFLRVVNNEGSSNGYVDWLSDFLSDDSHDFLNFINILYELSNADKVSALDENCILRPNRLFLQLEEIEKSVYELARDTSSPVCIETKMQEADNLSQAELLCKLASSKVLDYCREILGEEKTIISKLKFQATRRCLVIGSGASLVLSGVVAIKHFYDAANDIEVYYKDNLLKDAKEKMEAIPYPHEIYDSKDPAINDTNQRRRMDYIRDLNFRYFKLLALILKPDISKELDESKEASRLLKEELNNVRLSTLFSQDEWDKEIEVSIGPNVLTQLRAYGAFANFLIPTLAHFIHRDKNGEVLMINKKPRMNNPLPEKEYLRQIFIKRFKKVPSEQGIEPKNFIDKYDDNYHEIVNVCKKVLNRVEQEKDKLFSRYRNSSNVNEREKILLVLEVVAKAECRLKDLKQKIQERHEEIITKNTYRAPMR